MHLSEARTRADSDVYPFRHALPSRSARARLNATDTRRSRRPQVNQTLKVAAPAAARRSARSHELQQAWSCSTHLVEEAPACREQKRARVHVADAARTLVYEKKQPLSLEDCESGKWDCEMGLSQKVLRLCVKAAQVRVGKRAISTEGGPDELRARLAELMREGKIDSPFVVGPE